MSMHITIENYEAFYLDYLEGNLSGEALLEFETFLAAHPDLKMDEELLVTLHPTDEFLDPIQKLSLKQGIDFTDLSHQTIDFFLIAREEGLLTSEQEAHLNHWLEANAHYQQDARLYALTKFKPDAAVVFTDKETLKKPVGGRVITLWFTGLAVAAGLTLLFTIGLNNENSIQKNGNPIAKIVTENSTLFKHGKADSTQQENSTSVTPTQTDQQGSSNVKKRAIIQQPSTPIKRPANQRDILHEGTVLASLEKRHVQLTIGDKTITPLTNSQPQTPILETEPNEDMAIVTVNDMKNPIQPVTTSLSEKLNTPIDFRTAKAAKKKGGGFYFKIGKLEVSHQTASL